MRVLKRLSGVMAALLAMLLMVGSASAATMDGYDVSNFQSETVTRDAPGDFAIVLIHDFFYKTAIILDEIDDFNGIGGQ